MHGINTEGHDSACSNVCGFPPFLSSPTACSRESSLGADCSADSAPAGLLCLELGAGVGLVGLALARLNAHVTLTDKGPLLGLLRRNIAANWLGSPCVR